MLYGKFHAQNQNLHSEKHEAEALEGIMEWYVRISTLQGARANSFQRNKDRSDTRISQNWYSHKWR